LSVADLKIAFHIGLHKTGTTFMQRHVFSAWPGLNYLRFRNLEYFLRLDPSQAYLVSCEGLSGSTFAPIGERLEAVRRLAEMFPRAKIIISFRRHGDYLASLYSQYLRYGGKEPFDRFFADAGGGSSLLQPQDILFNDILEEVRARFGHPPFIYTTDDIREQLPETLDDLGAFLGVAPPFPPGAARREANAGLRRGSAGMLRHINRFTHCPFSRDGRRRPYGRLARFKLDPPTLLMRWGQWIDGRPILEQERKTAISERFSADWHRVLEHRREHCQRRSAEASGGRSGEGSSKAARPDRRVTPNLGSAARP
jgi:hypothetical protein